MKVRVCPTICYSVFMCICIHLNGTYFAILEDCAGDYFIFSEWCSVYGVVNINLVYIIENKSIERGICVFFVYTFNRV